MNALIIKKPWIDLILDGKKIWEVRGSNTKIRGKIALIESGSGKVVGECEILDSISLDERTYKENIDKHLIENIIQMPYKKTYAWCIEKPQRYKEPKTYRHPKGAIIWVKI